MIPAEADYRRAVELLRSGELVAFPTETVYGLSLIHISEPTRPYYISYAFFCLKQKKNNKQKTQHHG